MERRQSFRNYGSLQKFKTYRRRLSLGILFGTVELTRLIFFPQTRFLSYNQSYNSGVVFLPESKFDKIYADLKKKIEKKNMRSTNFSLRNMS